MILKTIKNEIEAFQAESIKIVDGFEFNQKSTIELIYLYYNSKYKSGDIDEQGDKKYFYNIGRVPCSVGTKATNFDTKHIRIQTASGGNPLKTWFFERDLKFWMKDQRFGKTLNRIFHELPIFGSVVLKVIDGKLYFVDLRNFVVEQSADDLSKANYIIEKHNYTPVDFRRVAKEKGWNNIEETIDAFREMGNEPFIRVYERYGEVEEDGVYTYKRVIIADVGKDIEEGNEVIPHSGFILDEAEIDSHPYREFHWEKMPGRWLGIGVIEVLFDPQIRVNEISNQQVKSSYWSTLRLWQTRDEGVGGLLLGEQDNGRVLNVEADIKQIDMADRNLAYYQMEINRWLGNRDELTFSHDPIKGEQGASGVTLGATQLAASQAGSYFEQIQENVAMDIKNMLYDDVIPAFKKNNNTEHILRIAGEDLDELNSLIIDQSTKGRFLEYVARNNKIPSESEYEVLKTTVRKTIKKGKEKLVKIAKGFYDDVRYKIDIVITGEAMDTRTMAANLFAILQAITADPSMLQDPTKKKILFQYMEQGGLNPYDFDMSSEEAPGAPQLQGRAGGGVSKPAIAQTPISGTQQSTL